MTQTQKEPENDDGRPPFARPYPRTPELDRLVRAFQAGDYATVRAEAPKLAAGAADPEVAAAARDLRGRLEPDPMVLYLLGLAVALLVFLTAWVYLHRH